MPTIYDVAKLSGLSKTTVSRVINNHSYVSEEKKNLVLKAMKELNYTPNPSARKLRGQVTTTIGVIVPRIVNPFFSYLVDSIEQVAYKNGYHVLIFQSNEDKEKELAFLNLLKTKQVDGIIMTSIENDWSIIEPFTESGPILLCNEYVNNANVPIVRLDQYKGAYIGVKHLLEKGHRKIGYCTGGLFAEEGKDKDRNQGYQKALQEAGIEPDPKWIFVNQHSIEDGKQVVKKILSMEDRPTAIFTGSDEIAGGMMIEAKECDLKIPNDLAIIGFDDQPLAQMLDPKLTTIRQPIDQMGVKAMETLIDMLNDSEVKVETFELPIELVVRSST
ncbi:MULTISPECIES: LacI family DNA-binding transcriptional regulator [Priestia]|jgi:LacI family transcriptional regulator|uniref:LacI family DNA-binding transcriptional regulator n=1 Tax=Priestia TaxID=2800373 RepID=UPI00094C9ED5|nr:MULTISPECIES: LacI family DNA-binding transcriptional regulator [Priestia]MBY0091921.1 LacI family DNA-binding transcriptional regulator [Priestia aryabhattai]MBY0099829.1 LacI family DNA-binding transcriptional regulator [Priestia aryabhattai]MCM3097930.1 LacI family transcriptional regulator [Priestia megaterium]MED4026375.1 LacI family DNA-binding transcriptional regulator [Priestia megaterium]OLO41037.1 LacI family transcriptional regulator [Priestia megaterium]